MFMFQSIDYRKFLALIINLNLWLWEEEEETTTTSDQTISGDHTIQYSRHLLRNSLPITNVIKFECPNTNDLKNNTLMIGLWNPTHKCWANKFDRWLSLCYLFFWLRCDCFDFKLLLMSCIVASSGNCMSNKCARVSRYSVGIISSALLLSRLFSFFSFNA